MAVNNPGDTKIERPPRLIAIIHGVQEWVTIDLERWATERAQRLGQPGWTPNWTPERFIEETIRWGAPPGVPGAEWLPVAGDTGRVVNVRHVSSFHVES